MIYRKISIFFSFISLFICSFLEAGFIEGTLVKTPHGCVPIQKLQVDDEVYAYDMYKNEFVVRSIVATKSHDITSVIYVQANKNHLFVDAKQLFYLPLEKKWCSAKDLQPGMVLQSYHGQRVLVEKVNELNVDSIVHDLSLNEPHTFCVTKDGIVVHNVVFTIPILVFGPGGISLASGIMYSAACGVGALLYYKFLADTSGATVDPNLGVSSGDFLGLQEYNSNHTITYNGQSQQYVIADPSYTTAKNTTFAPQKTSVPLGSCSFESYPGVHDTQSFPIPKLPTSNTCILPEKNKDWQEISKCPPHKEEENVPTFGCGQPQLPEPFTTGGCLPSFPEPDIVKCPGIVGAWDPEDARTSCNWSKNPPMPGLLEISPESSDDETIDTDTHDEPDTDNKPPAEDKAQGQDSELTPEKNRKKNIRPPKESDRPWDLPDHDPAIDIEKIDFSLTPHLTEEEIELIKECIKRFLGTEGLLANDSPLWRILKHEAQKKGALFELEYIIKLSDQGCKIIRMGYEVKVLDGLVEIDIETDTELIECKSGVWELKREKEIKDLKAKLRLGQIHGNNIQKLFVVVSKKPIPTIWKNWLEENNINYRENHE